MVNKSQRMMCNKWWDPRMVKKKSFIRMDEQQEGVIKRDGVNSHDSMGMKE